MDQKKTEKNSTDNDLFDEVMDQLLGESMIPFLMLGGLINPLSLAMSMARLILASKSDPDLTAKKIVDHLEADAYRQMVAAGTRAFTNGDRQALKSMIRDARAQAQKALDSFDKANKATLN